MKAKYILVGLLLVSFAFGERSYVITQGGLKVHVIEFLAEENFGFEVVDGDKRKNFVSDHYSKEAHAFLVNGGYFDGHLNPVGRCRINAQDVSATFSTELSGFLTVTDGGEIELHWKELPIQEYRDIIQAGPFIIDPDGEIGIHTRSGKAARRTVIGVMADQRVLILSTSEVYLYDLARVLKSKLPDLERALNLDGGPSVGLMYGDVQMKNLNPVRNFLRKRKKMGMESNDL